MDSIVRPKITLVVVTLLPNHLNVAFESGTTENTTHVAAHPCLLGVIFNLAKLRNKYFGCNLILFYGPFQTEILGGGLYCIFLASAASSMHPIKSTVTSLFFTHLFLLLHVNNSGSWESNKI